MSKSDIAFLGAGVALLVATIENDKIKVTKKGKIKTTKIGYFFDCKKIV